MTDRLAGEPLAPLSAIDPDGVYQTVSRATEDIPREAIREDIYNRPLYSCRESESTIDIMTNRLIQSGNYDAKYLIVSEAPGEDEDQYRRPFVGVSGWENYKMLEESRWLSPGSASHIIKAFHPYYNEEKHRMSISNPDFLPLDQELDKTFIFITNICHIRPPNNDIDRFFASKAEAKRDGIPFISNRYPTEPIQHGIEQLRRDITNIQPTFVLALGGTALWALTGLEGITKWRGSILRVENGPIGNLGTKLIATFHPADILREWSHRFVAIRDMRRALYEREFPEVREKPRNYIIRPSFAEAMEWLDEQSQPERAQEPLGGDIETPWGRWNLTGHIACMGFSASRSDAICIPLMNVTDKTDYWPDPDQETQVVLAMKKLMTTRPMFFHKSVFDVMHIIRHWGFIPRCTDDTMVMQHVRFPGLLGAGKADPVTGRMSKKGSSLSLVFCASMYCEFYKAWKDDNKNWDQKEIPNEEDWWRYNQDDTTYMYECFEVLRGALHRENLWKQYRFLMSLLGPVLYMMLQGFPLDNELLHTFRQSVRSNIKMLQQWIEFVCGQEINTGSIQLQKFFYDDLRVKKVMKGRGTAARPTLDNSALETIAKRSPVLGPLCYAISDQRSQRHFDENMLSIRMNEDRRAHTEINITGTETMRFTSTESCFGEGLNLQNLNRME